MILTKFYFPTQPIFVTDNIQTNDDDEIELNDYVLTLFDGLDIEKEFEWEQCIEFTKQINSLLIVELYSKSIRSI